MDRTKRALLTTLTVILAGVVSSASAQEVLILQNNAPWGQTYWNDQVAGLGLSPTQLNYNALPGIQLSDYDLIIVPSQQPGAFNTAINSYAGDLTTYIQDGGALILMLNTWTVYEPKITDLPYFATATPDTSDDTFVNAMPNHPIMAGIPGSIPGYGAGGYLTGFGNALPLSVDGLGRTTSYVLVDGCGGAYVSYLALEWVDPVNPNPLTPICGKAIDYMLKGMHDQDEDGYVDAACGGDDCDDGHAAVHPEAAEVCNDGVDNDCDGLVDEDDEDCPETDDDSTGDDDSAGDDDSTGDDDSMGDDDSTGDDDATGPSGDDDSDPPGQGDDCTCRLDRAAPGIPSAAWFLSGMLLALRRRRRAPVARPHTH